MGKSKKAEKVVSTQASPEEIKKLEKLHRYLFRRERVDILFRSFYFRVFTLVLMGFTIFNAIHVIRSLI